MHMLAYNLIRCLMWQVASSQGRGVHRLSFAGTVQRLDADLPSACSILFLNEKSANDPSVIVLRAA